MIITIPVEIIEDNPWQTRQVYDDPYITELAADIRRNGLLQAPAGRIIIRNARYDGVPVEESFPVPENPADWHDTMRVQLAIGHNRVRAYRLLAADDPAYATIPTQIGCYDDQAMARMAWSENAQRKDLSPLEEARAIQHAMESFGWSQARAGEEFGLNRATVANKLRLLKLPADVQEHLHTGKMSERQAGRLLPLYQLPAPALRAAFQPPDTWNEKPTDVVSAALGGLSSEDVEHQVERIMARVLRLFEDKHFPPAEQVAEGHPDVRQGRCSGCPMIVKRNGSEFCADKTCYDHKTQSWRDHLIDLAMKSSGGLHALDERKILLWRTEVFSYGDEAHGHEIIAAGCPRDNLHLYYDPSRKGGIRASSVPEVRIVCHKDGKPCYCLQKMQRENRQLDPAEMAEKEAKKRLENEIVTPAANALIAALAQWEPEAWRIVLKENTCGLKDKSLDGEWRKLLHHIGRRTISQAVPWYGHNDLDKARAALDELLHPAHITPAYPDAAPGDPLPDIRRRFARVSGWIEKLSQHQPTVASIRGNIENLKRIRAKLDALPDEQVEEMLNGEVDIALTLLRDLLPICIDDAVALAQGFEHVSWLTSVPPGDLNFKHHLKEASATVLRYALPIVRSYGDGGHKTRREMLELRLRQLAG